MSDAAVEDALISGEHRDLLEGYFGEDAYEELRSLCTRSRAARVRGGPRVLVLPGIMGSKLGTKGAIFDDVIWLDPLDIAGGELNELRLPGGDPHVTAVGVILFAYLKLKLRLRLAGFDADFHPFDWRRSVPDLGRELAERVDEERQGGAGDLYLVAHSMGGLVSRAAMKWLAAKPGQPVRRLIMLGTPNFGSFSAVQALSGYHDTVRKVAAIDLENSHETLVNEVFNTFPGLYQLLPAPQKFSSLDLYDPASWPDTGFAPRKAILASTPDFHAELAPGADNVTLIAGVNRETIVGVRREGEEFVFATSYAGDGTVPLEFALLDGAETYYVEETHGSLPNNGDVARAVIDLIETGATSVLAQAWTPTRRSISREVRGSDLVSERPFDGRTGTDVSERELRHLLDDFASPPRPVRETVSAAVVDAPGVVSGEPIVIGRKRQSRVDLVVACGDITQLNTRALVLGVYKDVPPAGPALAIDRQLDGAITDFAERRLFRANVGDVFIMPANRSRLRTDMVVFVGLGTYDGFSGELLRQVAENVARVLARTRVDEFGTVLLGAGSGMAVGDVLANLTEGFLRGIREGNGGTLRGITFVEHDRDRFQLLHREILRLTNTSLFDGVEATVYLDELPAAPAELGLRGAADQAPGALQPIYLLVREMTAPTKKVTNPSLSASFTLRASLLTAGAKATVITDEMAIDAQALNKHLAVIETSSFTLDKLDDFGKRLARLTLPALVRKALAAHRRHPLMVIHDARTSRIPWETVTLGETGKSYFPAAETGLSRKYEAEDLSVAKWLEERRLAEKLSVLLVVDPTEDLPGAVLEGDSIEAILAADSSVDLTVLRKSAATLAALRAAFRSGRYDVVHYAGHAFFDPVDRTRSGLVCHGDVVLTGKE
ncbi:MAG: alpha/beta fold hydrolase, partial [Gammaproteobacteria bacterium]|nr:alpha/beta fold hydrolase [Gammaproteobacteria bacterium]